jgi:hypothetical protein
MEVVVLGVNRLPVYSAWNQSGQFHSEGAKGDRPFHAKGTKDREEREGDT